MFRGKYYPNNHVFHSFLESSPSFVWKRLVWGEDLLCKGLSMRIGSGGSTYVFGNPWIPSYSCFKAITVRDPSALNYKVNEFI